MPKMSALGTYFSNLTADITYKFFFEKNIDLCFKAFLANKLVKKLKKLINIC